MIRNMLYAFPDSNALMRFQTFDEVAWEKVLGAKHVCLVIAPTVMRELDKFKDDHTNSGRRDRVRTLLAKLKPLLANASEDAPAAVRSNVTMYDIAREPVIEWVAEGLDPSIEDDRLIASILEFAAMHHKDPRILVSNDWPAQRKAKRHDVEFFDPEGVIDRVELASPEASELKRLRAENVALKSRTPDVDFALYEQGSMVRHVTRNATNPRSADMVGDAVATEMARAHGLLRDEVLNNVPSGQSQKVLDKFLKECKTYMETLGEVLTKRHARDYGHRVTLTFVLDNGGTAAAEDVDVEVRFPKGSVVVRLSDELSDVWGMGDLSMPKQPVPPWLKPASIFPAYELAMPYVEPRPQPKSERPRGPLYSHADRSRIFFEHPKLRQKDRWYPETVVAFVPIGSQSVFDIEYTLRADNLPKPIEEKLTVVLSQKPDR